MSIKKFMGIDPGLKGAIAIITDSSAPNVVFADEMYKTSNNEIDIKKIMMKMQEITTVYGQISFCFLEKAQAMSKQGVISTFNYGKGYGMLRAFLEIYNIPFQEIHPMKWKKEFSLVKTTKDDSISVARKMFPELTDESFITPRGRKKDGIAEALLLAEFCKRSSK